MSSPLAATPLIPRANKAKKKRPGFRPVGKSGKGGGSNSKSNRPPSISQEKKPPPSEEVNDEKDDEMQQRLEVGESSAEPSKEQTSKDTTIATATRAASSKTALASRKRKQSTSISVGFRSTSKPPNDKDDASSTANKHRSIATRFKSDEEAPATTNGAENETETLASSSPRSVRNSSALPASKLLAPAAQVPTTQDRDTLDRLAAEAPESNRLTSFCSTFKGENKTRKLNADKNTQGVKPSQSNNRNNRQSQNPNRAVTNSTQTDEAKRDAQDASGAPVVQIIDGEIVLQESSLVVPGQRRTVQEVEEEFQDVVEEDAQLAIVGASYTSFKDRKGSQRWTVAETKRFFEALRQLGTDFCSMEVFFENRTRKQLKRKYRAELIRNPALVELALHPKNKSKVELSVFNVEVDPRAIEAAAKEEPPPYIPTDVEEIKDSGVNGVKFDENKVPSASEAFEKTLTGDSIGGADGWKEVVDEDAEEERKEAAESSSSRIPNVKSATESSILWPTSNDDEVHGVVEDEIHFPEPSMDDFFHDQEAIVDPGMLEEGTELQNIEVSASGSPDKEAPPEAPQAPAAPAISLVPTKAGKSKKPKFRSRSRKKK